MVSSKKILAAAEKTAKWFLLNQPQSRLNANRGRFLVQHDAAQEDPEELPYSTSWDTGCSLCGLLALWKRTGKKEYLEAAEKAGHYIMSLQVLDTREKQFYGAFREVTPQSMEFCPRDATSAAWSLIYLAEATGDKEYLNRARIFGDWMLEYGMFEGWPRWAVLMDGQDHFYAKGSFQSGVAAFFHDLFMATRELRYIERGMRPIAQQYRDEFFHEDGRIVLGKEIFSNQEREYQIAGKDKSIEFEMHYYNDDFGNISLMRAAELFGEESYRERAYKWAKFLMAHQDKDGNFAKGTIPSAVPQALIYYHDLGEYYKDKEMLAARDFTLKKLLDMQFDAPDDKRLDGAFPHEALGRKGHSDKFCGLRCTMYALTALLHVESDIPEVWLGRANKKFEDPLWTISQKPYVFKW